MNPQTWWYLARATGYVAWALVTTSVISGLLLSTRLTNGRPRPAWTLDLHRFLAGTDASHPASKVATALAIAAVVFLTLVRALSGKGRNHRSQQLRRPDPASTSGARSPTT